MYDDIDNDQAETIYNNKLDEIIELLDSVIDNNKVRIIQS
jgi:hypothetical protein